MAPTPKQTLAVLEAKVKSLCSQLDAIYDLSKKVTADCRDLFITKAKRVDKLREQYESAFTECETMKVQIDPEYKPQFSGNFSNFFEIADKIETVVTSLIHQKEKEERTVELSSNSSTSVKSKIKMEPIKLPNFDGSPENWTPFYQLYVELVHLNTEYSNLQKVTFLTSHLTGAARSIVTGIPPTAENYTTLFDTLVSRFQDKRALGTYYLDKIMNFKPMSHESEKSLNSFLEVFVESSEAIKQLGINDTYDFVMLYLASKKLDNETMRLFDMANRTVSIPKFDDLVTFVRSQVKIVGRGRKSFVASPPTPPKSSLPQGKTFHTYVLQNSKHSVSSRIKDSRSAAVSSRSGAASTPLSTKAGVCGCPKNHPQLYRCDLFTQVSPVQRWKMVKQRRACINCLSFGHMRQECRSPGKCRVPSCGRSHHSLLHRTDGEFSRHEEALPARGVESAEDSPSPVMFASSPEADTKTVACCSTKNLPQQTATILLATAVVLVKDQLGNSQPVRCLLDAGSESCLVSRDLCDRLGLSLSPSDISVKGLGSSQIRVYGNSTFTFHSRINDASFYEVTALVVDELIDALPTTPIDTCNLQHVAHLQLADPDCLSVGKIDFLIGAELWPYIVGHRKVFGPPNTPVGLQSTLGYLIMGRTSASPVQANAITPTVRLCVVREEEQSLNDLLKRFWELDTISTSKILSPDDQKCEEIFLETHTRCPDGRYMVQLPFRESPALLGDSLTGSMSRFFSMEKRLLKTPEMHTLYGAVVKEYLADGTVIKLDRVEDQQPSFYLPHHGVYKPSSLTTPLRLVFNGSAQSSSGKSLNQLLYVGEKLQKDVFSILLNLRLFEYVLCTDIRRMFLRIRVDPAHRRFLRFLWRFSPHDPLDVYEFTSLVFGLTSSPFLAQRVVKALCEDEGQNFELAREVVERDAYVDDITSSVRHESQLFELYHQLTQLFSAGGFELSKWGSNSENFLQHIPEGARQTQHVAFDQDEVTKVLGVQWHPLTDVFTCSIDVDDVVPTKRRMASLLARIFDPLGLISPVTVQVKLLLREMWEKKLGWDAELPDELRNRCIKFKQALPVLSALSIPRFSTITDSAETILIGFCDASEKAYGAVLYIRTQVPNCPPEIRLLCARVVIAPMKLETIPRLELCAAVLLAKLMRHVIETYDSRHRFNKCLAFSDSTVTLHWIHSHPSQWKIFVANRVAKIQENLEARFWHFVPGDRNPADVLSRGSWPADLLSHPHWVTGPRWLSLPEREWFLADPVGFQEDAVSSELKPPRVLVVSVATPSPLESIIEHVSQYRRLLRATAYVFRFCRRTNIREPIVSYAELCNAEMYWVKLIQAKYFAELKDSLLKGHRIPDAFRCLDVFIDDSGVLRVGGRLRHAALCLDQKHPILLPKRDRFVDLLIDQYHFDYFHAGAQLILSYISQKYWILSAGVRIRSRLRRCLRCFRVKPKEKTAKMAHLPKERVQGYKCFATTGVDYAGPFSISWSRRRGARPEKAYICLFVCFAVKAVHLELVSDLTTAKFLDAFKRFLARRGPCARLESDCGSNFSGAKRELRELHQLMSSRQFNERVGNDLAARGVEWRLNPARAPHFGGLWEANIKSMKSHLKKVIGTQVLTYEEMITVLAQIEAIMNSRPLCKRLLNDSTAPAALTPAHFLTLGSSLDKLPAEDVMDVPLNRLNRYQLIDRVVQEFWRRWHREYLHTLQSRGKWFDSTTPIAVGTVVVLKEDNVPPLCWPLGIVESVHPGDDGEVRVVTVRTATNTFKRPVVKVCPLPSTDEE